MTDLPPDDSLPHKTDLIYTAVNYLCAAVLLGLLGLIFTGVL